MKSVHLNSEDPCRMVDADRGKVSLAFDQWQMAKGRAKRGSELGSDKLFEQAVRSLLDTKRDIAPRKLGIPSTRQGYANWRAGRCRRNFRLRLDVCEAIFLLTNVDVTSNGFLASSPLNATDIVTLGKVKTENSDDGTTCRIVVSSVDFHRSASKVLRLSDTTDHPKETDRRTRVGTFIYALSEASISVEGKQSLTPVLVRLLDRRPSDYGAVEGADVMVDPDETLRWRVQPAAETATLQARLEKLRLCTGELLRTGEITVLVSAQKIDVNPIIQLERPVEKFDAKYEKTRQRLIEQILRNRLPDRGLRQRFVLSQSKAYSQ